MNRPDWLVETAYPIWVVIPFGVAEILTAVIYMVTLGYVYVDWDVRFLDFYESLGDEWK